MLRTWNSADERRYVHAKKSARNDGKSDARAKALAARVVHRHRQLAGPPTEGSHLDKRYPVRPLAECSKVQLVDCARRIKIRGRSRMNKLQLIAAISEQQESDAALYSLVAAYQNS